MFTTVSGETISVVPANTVSWDHLALVLGSARCHGAFCYCQRFKIPNAQWRQVNDAERARRLKAQTHVADPQAAASSGLIAYIGGEPVGWCAVEPRTAYVNLVHSRVPWSGRREDKNDDAVWAVTCFIVRTGYRRRGGTYALTKAAASYAQQHGARALEGYPMITMHGHEITWGELPSEATMSLPSLAFGKSPDLPRAGS